MDIDQKTKSEEKVIAEDLKILHSMGYAQELLRRMNGFSNFAISFSIICILAGGITSFQLGFNSVGGASIGLGWPLSVLFSLLCALSMGQVASAFPTAGGLYHWSSVLGGKGWGWVTAWFNIIGLVTILSAINVGAFLFMRGAIGPLIGFDPESLSPASNMAIQVAVLVVIFLSQAVINHRGIHLTSKLTDFSGYLIFVVSIALTFALVYYGAGFDFSRLVTFKNYSGSAGGGVWPATDNLSFLFLLGLLLPAYTITGFDASAHTSEETINAARNVPRGIVKSVFWSGLFGWLMLIAIVLAIPNMDQAAAQGGNVFFWIMESVLPSWLRFLFYIGISLAQYLCGLATLTSASRMFYAFARDGGMPFSGKLKRVSTRHRTPSVAIWVAAALSLAFTIYTPVYSTITVICVIFLYVSYLIPVALGLFAYGRSWTKMGPWNLGGWYRAVAVICLFGCVAIIYIGIQPPNEKALTVSIAALVLSSLVWFGYERRRFAGPPQIRQLSGQRVKDISVSRKPGLEAI